jgi:replicative DNA helicase
MEHKLLSAIYTDREAYEELNKYADREDFSDLGSILYDKAVVYYKQDINASFIDKELVLSQLEREYPKQLNQFKSALNNLEEVSVPNLLAEYAALKKQQVGHKLAVALTENNHDVEDLIEEYKIYDRGELVQESRVDVVRDESIFNLVSRTTGGSLLPLYPSSLSDCLDGGIVRGSHIIVFGRPDGGKSLFSINAAAGYCEAGFTTLYVGNEDPADQLILRAVTNMSGMDKYSVIENPAKAEQRARSKGYGNFIFASLTPGTPAELRSLVEEYKPDVIFIDQLRNINVFEANKVLQLEKAAIMGRQLAKEYGLLCYSVTQAGDSAEDKVALSMGS